LALAEPKGFHRRDKLLALSWLESDRRHVRSALNTAIRFLWKNLVEDLIIGRGGEEFGLDWDRA
jgi:hypothetical protein